MAIKETTKFQIPKGVWTKITTDEKAVSLLLRNEGWVETTVSTSTPTAPKEDVPINASLFGLLSTKVIFGIPAGSSVYAWGVVDSTLDVDPSEV